VFYHNLLVTETERPKAVLTVQPEPSLILRGENVTLTCDILGEEWRWKRDDDDDREHNTEEKEFKTIAETTQKCRCYRGSNCSQWSDEVSGE